MTFGPSYPVFFHSIAIVLFTRQIQVVISSIQRQLEWMSFILHCWPFQAEFSPSKRVLQRYAPCVLRESPTEEVECWPLKRRSDGVKRIREDTVPRLSSSPSTQDPRVIRTNRRFYPQCQLEFGHYQELYGLRFSVPEPSLSGLKPSEDERWALLPVDRLPFARDVTTRALSSCPPLPHYQLH